MHDPQKIVGLKLRWVVITFVRWGRIQNFRPLGPLFLVKVEFVGGWCGVGVNSNNRVKPNLSWVYIELRLGWGFDNILRWIVCIVFIGLYILIIVKRKLNSSLIDPGQMMLVPGPPPCGCSCTACMSAPAHPCYPTCS